MRAFQRGISSAGKTDSGVRDTPYQWSPEFSTPIARASGRSATRLQYTAIAREACPTSEPGHTAMRRSRTAYSWSAILAVFDGFLCAFAPWRDILLFQSVDDSCDAVLDSRHVEVDQQPKADVRQSEVSQKLFL